MANASDLTLIQINEFPQVSEPGDWIVVSDAAGTGYRISKEDFKEWLGTVTVITDKPIALADPAPTLDGVYLPTEPGTYTNAGGLVYDPEGVDAGKYVQFIKNDTVWTKLAVEFPLPENKIEEWIAGTYEQGEQVIHNGQIWSVDVPSTTEEPSINSTDWKPDIDKISKGDLFTEASGVNLFNKDAALNGFRIAALTGLDFTEEGFKTSAVIPVKGDTVYYLSNRGISSKGTRFIDNNGNYLRPMQGTTPTATFEWPDSPFDDGSFRRSPSAAVGFQFTFAQSGFEERTDIIFAESDVIVPYEPYEAKISQSQIAKLPEELQSIENTLDSLTGQVVSNSQEIVDISIQASQALSLSNSASEQADEAYNMASVMTDLITSRIPKNEKGVAGGVATLNDNGKIPATQIDLQGYTLLGSWDASTNTPTLSDGTGTLNNYYIVSSAGDVDFGNGLVSFNKGDRVIYSADDTWILDAQKTISKPVSDAGLSSSSDYVRQDDSLYNIYNEYTRILTTYHKVELFPNGTPVTALNVDGILYRNIDGEFFADANFLRNGVVHTRDYGILTDGVTNDQPRFQKLINFLDLIGGGTIKLARGRTRLLNEGLKWFSNISLIGEGMFNSVLQCDATKTSNVGLNGIYNDDMTANGSVWNPLVNCYFGDFMIDCSGYHNVGVSYVGRKAMFILGMEYCQINRVFAYRSIGTGIGCDFLSRTSITGCIVMECGSYIGDGVAPEIGQSGIGIGSCSIEDESVLVEGNWCINNGNYQIFVETQSNPSGIKSHWAKIVNNHCYGGRYGIGNRGSGSIQVSGNTCYYQERDGIYHSFRPTGSIYQNNDIGYSGMKGININDGYTAEETIVISGNRVHHCNDYGIYINLYVNRVNVSDNTIYNNGLSGILVGYYCFSINVANNIIYNNGQRSVTGNTYGVFSRGCKFQVLMGNIIYDDQETKTQTVGIRLFKGLTQEESQSGYSFLTLKPTIVKGNIIYPYTEAQGIIADVDMFIPDDYILDGNTITQ